MKEPNFIEVNGIIIRYERTGEGSDKPPMVLVHGVIDNGRCWSRIAQDLARDYDVIYYDVRGHGLSDKPSSYKLKDHVNDLMDLISALGLENPILMGHSMGGGIVAQAAADYPELPRAVILEDPSFFPQPENLGDVARMLRSFLKSFLHAMKKKLLKRQPRENPGRSKGEPNSWLQSKLQFSPRVLETIQDLPDIEKLLPRIQAPVLLLKADASPGQRREDMEAASAIRNGRLIHIDGAGHVIHRDKPVETLKAVREFLDEKI